jgi:isocitrate dehydrogenase
MNGDIISDLSSALVGGLGFAPSANLGSDVAIFEAVHGSAPKYAGKNVINPTALVLSAVMMLRHLGEFEAAATVESALLATLEQGKTTRDIAGDEGGALSTTDFTDVVIGNFGEAPAGWKPRDYKPLRLPRVSAAPDFVHEDARRVIGVDVFVESGLGPDELGPSLEDAVAGTRLKLKAISNRGTRVYPPTGAMTDCIDQWFCRFTLASNGNELGDAEIAEVVQRIGARHRWMHVEKLQQFHGEDGFTKAQGED